MNVMKIYRDGLLEGPSGLTNAVSRLAPILGRDSLLEAISTIAKIIIRRKESLGHQSNSMIDFMKK